MLLSSKYSSQPNSLLSLLIRTINTDEQNFDSLQDAFNESSTEQLVLSFGYLGNWLITHHDPEKVKTRKFQFAYHYLHLIITKVPPIILICGLQDINWKFKKIHTNYSTILRSFFKRLGTICSFAKPFNFVITKNSKTFGISATPKLIDPKLDQKFPDIISKFNSSFNSESLYIRQFKAMLLNNEPLDSFTDVLEKTNTSFYLTNALQELLTYFNDNRKFTHRQLLYGFVMLFRYIAEFVSMNAIDGLIIAKYITNFPFYSPFFIIAMVTNIPTSLYLYDLLVPSQLTKGDLTIDEVKEAILNQYKIYDLSFDHELDRLIEKVPDYLFSYYLDNSIEPYTPVNQPPDYIDFILSIHLSMKSIRENLFQNILKNVDSLSPLQIVSISLHMSKNLIFFIPKPCITNNFDKYASPSFWRFFPALVTASLPAVEQFAPKLCETIFKESNDRVPITFLKATLLYCLNIFISLPFEKNFLPFLLKCLKRGEELQTVARLIIMKILRCTVVQITPKVIDLLKDCDDLIVLLDFIDFLENLTEVNQFDDLKNGKELIALLIQKIPYKLIQSPSFLLMQYTPNTLKSLNSCSQHVNKCIATILTSQNSNISRILNQEALPYLPLIIRALISSTLITDHETAQIITEKVISMLSTTNDNVIQSVQYFPLSTSHLVLPIAQLLLRQLLIFKHCDLAFSLLDAMNAPLLNDNTPLRWIARFLRKNYDHLTADVKTIFNQITMLLPCSEELYLSPIKGHTIRDALELVMDDKSYRYISPDNITHEISSSKNHIFYLSSISILVRTDPIQDIIDGIIKPIYEPFFAKHPDNAYYQIALLLNYMPTSISYGIIQSVLNRPLYPFPLKILKTYFMISPIDVFQKVCESLNELIASDGIKLRECLAFIIPNFIRLKQDQEIATRLACGLFENVNSTTERQLQETVIDTVGMLYIMLKLQKKRTALINSAQHFTPELKAIIASSFDIEFDPTRSLIQP